LGKVAWVESPLKNYAVGGFLGIYRFKDAKLAKAVYYRLMSAKFRMHVSGLRGQNINNLDIEKVDSCGIEVPKDLEKFIAEMKKKRNCLRGAQAKQRFNCAASPPVGFTPGD
jgi:hypothetical protein